MKVLFGKAAVWVICKQAKEGRNQTVWEENRARWRSRFKEVVLLTGSVLGKLWTAVLPPARASTFLGVNFLSRTQLLLQKFFVARGPPSSTWPSVFLHLADQVCLATLPLVFCFYKKGWVQNKGGRSCNGAEKQGLQWFSFSFFSSTAVVKAELVSYTEQIDPRLNSCFSGVCSLVPLWFMLRLVYHEFKFISFFLIFSLLNLVFRCFWS